MMTKAWRTHVQGKVGGCGKGAYAYAKGPIGCCDAPEALGAELTTDHDPEYESDDGDLDAAISLAARSSH